MYGHLTTPPDFSNVLKLLEDEGVAYLLIGGYAVGYYGYPRATAGMDIWVSVDLLNAARVCTALRRFGMADPAITPRLFLEKGKIVRIGVPPVRLGILTEIPGVDFQDCFFRRRRVDLGGFEANLIALDDLKINKRASGRHKDPEDLNHLP